jgi:hypothetical protein
MWDVAAALVVHADFCLPHQGGPLAAAVLVSKAKIDCLSLHLATAFKLCDLCDLPCRKLCTSTTASEGGRASGAGCP